MRKQSMSSLGYSIYCKEHTVKVTSKYLIKTLLFSQSMNNKKTMGYLKETKGVFTLEGMPFTGTAETISTCDYGSGQADGAWIGVWCTDKESLMSAYRAECDSRGYECYRGTERSEFVDGTIVSTTYID